MTMNSAEMNEEKAFTEDVKKMSHDDLMAAIRYLDSERQMIADRVHDSANHIDAKKEVVKRTA